ncbi:MAG: tetratricopeptide repeat protein [Acidobacteria bacterium]|nr:tetratricopeptide repeat protein [Acidobacteriota bacterium]MCI0719666.1 tetratricopeptide repeat protein [Acidobacteriota bacterium]
MQERHLLEAQSLIDQEKYSQGIDELKKAIVLDPSLSGAHNQVGYCHWRLGQFNEARLAFKRELRLEPFDSYSHYYLGLILLNEGDTYKAIEHFEQVLTTKPILDTHHHLGSAYLRADKVDKAIVHLEKAVEFFPEKPEARFNLGRAYALAGRKLDAEREFDIVRHLRAQQQKAIRDFTQCESFLKQNKIEEALAFARELMHSQDPDLLLNLGMLLGRNRLHREALQPLERAVSLRTSFFEAHYNIGLSLASSKDLTRAVDALRKAVRLRPDSYDAQSLLGLVMIQLGKDEEAISPLRKAVELRPNSPSLLGLLGLKYLERRYYQEATEVLRKAVDLQPETPPFRLLLIQAYQALGKPEEASKESEVLTRLKWKEQQNRSKEKTHQP